MIYHYNLNGKILELSYRTFTCSTNEKFSSTRVFDKRDSHSLSEFYDFVEGEKITNDESEEWQTFYRIKWLENFSQISVDRAYRTRLKFHSVEKAYLLNPANFLIIFSKWRWPHLDILILTKFFGQNWVFFQPYFLKLQFGCPFGKFEIAVQLDGAQ